MGVIKGAIQAAMSLLGGGSKSVSSSASNTLKADATNMNTGRAALYETTGGAEGEQLDPTQVKQRDTLFGN